ncbi:ATP-binding protein [Niastella vici]|uniref:ATP-binding protein n=1 Tax=Niastella vici TaxID=1703345 RepID=UPI00130205AC|nr:ATP-binding protein [Niastella vici]
MRTNFLREKMPKGCKLIMLCRTERKHLLKPNDNILSLELKPFSEVESLRNLQGYFPGATANDGVEFYRLTGGNPRVQANALTASYQTVTKLLSSFGPNPMTVEMQIEQQLRAAVLKINEHQTPNFQDTINAICVGLASLPPHIPISILASAAGVSTEAINSFVADLGRPLWISDSSVQFRDEPTETWFRKTYLADKKNYLSYIARLEPLATDSTYVAEVLPQLYLQAGEYEKLIKIALSDDLLPTSNPIDARNVRIFRLRFAFIAALKSQNLKDSVQLGMRAGEEVAGSNRQFFLFRNNIDLLAVLQGKEKVQEIAFKTKLRSGWDGSENIYTASLLSAISDYKGEARGYLRAAENWLSIYFKREKTEDDDHSHEEKLREQDILEFAYAHLNINGVAGATAFLNKLKPKEYVYRVVSMLAKRLIDAGKIEVLHQFAEEWQDEPYYVVSIAHEFLQVGKFLKRSIATKCLDKLSDAKTRIPKSENYFYDDQQIVIIISIIETCFHYKLASKKINLALDYYVPAKANNMVVSKHTSKDRFIFLKALAIRLILTGKSEIEIEEIVPAELLAKKTKHDYESDLKEYKECINGLLPWFILRANLLRGIVVNFQAQFQSTVSSSHQARTNRYSNYDPLPNEIAELASSILILGDSTVVNCCYQHLLSGNDFGSKNRLNLLRAAHRSEHLKDICDNLEQTTHELIESLKEEGPDEMAEKYISLSRAVAVNSVADASVYFDQAVEIVSKFGDELVRRWEALESLAERAAEFPDISDEFAYRFIRCAELVGIYVSREKHWDRSSAARSDAKLSPTTALAAISRWRDRIVGRYQYQLQSIIEYLVKSNLISPLCAWSLTHFFGEYVDLALICIEHESTKAGKQAILNDAVRILQMEGVHQEYVNDLAIIASKFGLYNDGLTNLVEFFATDKVEKAQDQDHSYLKKRNDQPDKAWDALFNDIQIDSLDGLTTLLEKLNNEPKDRFDHSGVRDILIEGLSRINHSQVYNYIDAVFLLDQVEIYDAKAILYGIPDSWKNKPALKAAWPLLIKKFGKHYAQELTNKFTFDYCVSDLQLSDILVSELKHGMYEGLQKGGLHDEETFFGFCSLSAPMLSPEEALKLTDYSMRRFELHIDDTLGDGPYSDKVAVDNDIKKSVAGFIWSALGSPWGWERWNAAHAIRSMGQLGCPDIIDALFDSLEHGEVGAYGSAEYIFYKLHAIQYFFIALARTSLSHPGIIVKHAGKISEYALGANHLLIQRFAADAALNIAAAFPSTYDDITVDLLRQVGKSPFKPRMEKYNYRTESIWHEAKEINTNIGFHFGWDFDRYWFQPLGDVFGIPGKQVEDIAADVVVNVWGMGDKSGYKNDPRVGLWNSSSSDRETWHDHGSYPKTDNLDFYLSYHSMMVAAAKLLKAMPVVETRGWRENAWNEWIRRHLLTIEDGRWLSDIRDPLPLNRPKWIKKQRTDDWQTDITEQDFRERLINTYKGENWICIGGGWYEKENERKENVSIRSAFVAKETSDALMRALQSCNDHHDYKIPDYKEDDMESTHGVFVLKGWIEYPSRSKGLDDFDPRSAEVSYPIISIGASVLSDLELVSEFNTWKEIGTTKEVIRCENWSTDRGERGEYTDQCGMRLKANMNFLMQACKKYQRDLIIEMVIDRDIIISRMGGSNKYGKPFVKILIISADGTIRTTEGSFGIG